MHDGSGFMPIALQVPVHPELSRRLLALADLRHQFARQRIVHNLYPHDMLRMHNGLPPARGGNVEILPLALSHADIPVSRRNPAALIHTPHHIADRCQHASSLGTCVAGWGMMSTPFLP